MLFLHPRQNHECCRTPHESHFALSIGATPCSQDETGIELLQGDLAERQQRIDTLMAQLARSEAAAADLQVCCT